MAIYLVMKNNIKRLMRKKSTYLVMILLPILLVLFGSVSSRIGERRIRVGVIGTSSYMEEVKAMFTGQEKIIFAMAEEKGICADKIMGKYHYVIAETEAKDMQNKILGEITKAGKGTGQSDHNLPAEQRMAAMLLTVYMTIATIYMMKYLKDKREGAIERFIIAGGKQRSYLGGYFLSNGLLMGVQLTGILLFWQQLDRSFSLPLVTLIQIFLFILIVSNVYAVFITLISKSEMMAGILGSSVAALLTILGGTFVAVEQMPVILQKISILSPMRWLMHLMQTLL